MTRLGEVSRQLKRFTQGIKHYVLPPISPLTGEVVDSLGGLGATQWGKLEFLCGSICFCCGIPLEQNNFTDARCAICEATPPQIRCSRSALVYSTTSRKLILNFKYGGRTDSTHIFSNWMIQAASDILQPPAILVPVPLHIFRRMHRKFNQSALLANALAKQCQMSHQPRWLVRHRNTPSQGLKSGPNRARNVQGAFRVPKRFADKIRGQRIVLVDDVRASGATLEACAKALLLAGATQIDAVTLARVVKPLEPTT
ncbi:MAG: ComF family protein [Robiginitomaculum sp.]|nr:ComF family protein [Robiginitomaculum sp.]